MEIVYREQVGWVWTVYHAIKSVRICWGGDYVDRAVSLVDLT